MPVREQQKTNKQHAVPQNIMDVEFKIIGDLTLRQFLYLLVFLGIAYISMVYIGGILKWPLVIIFTLLGLGLAFVPIQERGMDIWIISFIKAMYQPTQKIWRKDLQIPSPFLWQNMAVVQQEIITLAPTSSRRKLEEYLRFQDEEEKDDLDIPEQKYATLVRQAFAGVTGVDSRDVATSTQSSGIASSYVSVTPQVKPQPIQQPTTQTAPVVEEPVRQPIPEKKEPEAVKQSNISEVKPPVTEVSKPPISTEPKSEAVSASQVSTTPTFTPETPAPRPLQDKPREPMPTPEQKREVVQPKPQPQQQPAQLTQQPYQQAPEAPRPQPQQQVQPQQQQQIQPKAQPQAAPPPITPAVVATVPLVSSVPQPSQVPPAIKRSKLRLSEPFITDDNNLRGSALKPLTPDRHSGRKFNSLLPKQGEIVLPIRGERVLSVESETKLEGDIQEKAEQLNKLISQIKSDTAAPKPEVSVQQQPVPRVQPPSAAPAIDLKTAVGSTKESSEPHKGFSHHAKNVLTTTPQEEVKKEEKPKEVSTNRILSMETSPVVNLFDSFKSKLDELTRNIFNLEAEISKYGGSESPENAARVRELNELNIQKEKTQQELGKLQDKHNELEERFKREQAQKEKLRQESEMVKSAAQKTLDRKQSDYEAMRKQILDLQQQLGNKNQQPKEFVPSQPVKLEASAPVEKAPTVSAKVAPIQALTTQPDVITGVVSDSNNKMLDGLVIVIKNNRGDTVRALKTNSLGQFKMISPLQKGMYNIEVDQYGKSGYKFDIVTVEVKGEILPPIQFVGKE